jgi:hypothetical protein
MSNILTATNRSDFVAGYTEALLWSTSIDTEDGSCDGTAYSRCLEVDPESLARIERCALDFLESNERALDLACEGGRDFEHLGHDAHLTREGHGTGFWDRDDIRPILRDHLTSRARADRTEAAVWVDVVDGEPTAFVEVG